MSDEKVKPWSRVFGEALIAAFISSTVVGGFINWKTNKFIEDYKFDRDRKAAMLEGALSPIIIHIERTKELAESYGKGNKQLYREAVVLRDSNRTVRDLILMRSHLIPTELSRETVCLLSHYDSWLLIFDSKFAEFQRQNNGRTPGPDDILDIGFENRPTSCMPQGGFPKEAANKFADMQKKVKIELYGI